MKNFTEAFTDATKLNLKYVVIKGFEQLPTQTIKLREIIILTSDLRLLVKTMGLRHVHDVDYEFVFNGASPIPVEVYETGKGVLPPQFETIILERAVLHNDIIKVPDDFNAFLILMYIKMHYFGYFAHQEERNIVRSYLHQRTGEATEPEYDHLKAIFQR